MNTRVTLVVLITAALLAGYFVVFESGLLRDNPDTNGNGTDRAGTPLFKAGQLPPAGVQRIKLKLGDDAPVVVSRDANGTAWRQTHPFAFAVNGAVFDQFVNIASALRYTSKDPIGDDAKALGLAPPRFALTVSGEHEGKAFEYTLKFGRASVAGLAYLALDDGETAYLVDAALHQALDGLTPESYRATLLPEVAANTVESVTLVRERKPITLDRKENRWALVAPHHGRASDVAAMSLISVFGRTSIDKFVDDQPKNLARYGLDKPAVELRLRERAANGRPARTHTLRIGAPADLSNATYYAQLDELTAVFTLRGGDVERLLLTADDLRDPRLTPVRHADLREIELEPKAGAPMRFAMSAGRWVFGEPKPDFAIESTAVTDLINALLVANAERFQAVTDDVAHDVTVTLTTAGGRAEVLRITRYETHDAVVRGDEGVTYIVKRGLLDGAFGDAQAFRARQVLSVTPAKVKQLSIERTGKYAAKHELAKADGRWRFEGFERNAIDALVVSLNPLRCERWVTPNQPLTFDLTITLVTEAGDTYKLQVDTQARIGTMGDGYFVLDAAAVERLAAELRNRDLLPVTIDEIASVGVNDERYDRSAEGMYTLAGGGAFDERTAGALFDTLAGLRAERYITPARAQAASTAPVILTIELRDGARHELKVWQGATPHGQLGDRHFTLKPATVAPLVALSR